MPPDVSERDPEVSVAGANHQENAVSRPGRAVWGENLHGYQVSRQQWVRGSVKFSKMLQNGTYVDKAWVGSC